MRQTQTRRIKTDDIQGEDSYVDMTSPRVKEIRAIQVLPAGEDYEASISLLSKHIVGWNWTDENDVPIPSPQDDPDAIGELTNDELLYLLRAVGSGGVRKN